MIVCFAWLVSSYLYKIGITHSHHSYFLCYLYRKSALLL